MTKKQNILQKETLIDSTDLRKIYGISLQYINYLVNGASVNVKGKKYKYSPIWNENDFYIYKKGKRLYKLNQVKQFFSN